MRKLSDITPVSDVKSATGTDDTEEPDADIEASRKEAHETQENARTAKATMSPEWKNMRAETKELRGRIDEEGDRIRKARHRNKRHQLTWEGIWSIGGAPRGGGNKDDPRQEDSSVREFRNQLGRSLFVGGIPHTVSSGIAQ